MDRRLNSGPFVAYVFSSIYITKVGKEREGNSFLLVTTVHFRINIYSRRVQMRVTKRIDCSPPPPPTLLRRFRNGTGSATRNTSWRWKKRGGGERWKARRYCFNNRGTWARDNRVRNVAHIYVEARAGEARRPTDRFSGEKKRGQAG